jgi:hypothetical protein
MAILASIRGDCFLRILKDLGFEEDIVTPLGVAMIRPSDDEPIVVRPDQEYLGTVIEDWLRRARIDLNTFLDLRRKHCPFDL